MASGTPATLSSEQYQQRVFHCRFLERVSGVYIRRLSEGGPRFRSKSVDHDELFETSCQGSKVSSCLRSERDRITVFVECPELLRLLAFVEQLLSIGGVQLSVESIINRLDLLSIYFLKQERKACFFLRSCHTARDSVEDVSKRDRDRYLRLLS